MYISNFRKNQTHTNIRIIGEWENGLRKQVAVPFQYLTMKWNKYSKIWKTRLNLKKTLFGINCLCFKIKFQVVGEQCFNFLRHSHILRHFSTIPSECPNVSSFFSAFQNVINKTLPKQKTMPVTHVHTEDEFNKLLASPLVCQKNFDF